MSDVTRTHDHTGSISCCGLGRNPSGPRFMSVAFKAVAHPGFVWSASRFPTWQGENSAMATGPVRCARITTSGACNEQVYNIDPSFAPVATIGCPV
eukprot:5076787-Pyramimonas_sp.AAC.2